MAILEYLRAFHFISVLTRMSLAVLLGGAIGIERVRKHRPAGFRTHMLVCFGASLTMILSQYQYEILQILAPVGDLNGSIPIDISRFGAQVVNGIGFLGAGTILVSGQHQQIKGLTTASCLWASATMGLAIGAGFYEAVFIVFILMEITIHILPHVEAFLIQFTRDMMVYVEFQHVSLVQNILNNIKELDVQVRHMEIEQETTYPHLHPSVVLMLHLPAHLTHESLLAHIATLDGLYVIEEL